MRSSRDALRSVKKYLAETTLPKYEVRLHSEDGTFERPYCRVGWTTPAAVTAHGARLMEHRRTLQIVAWPEEVATADEAYDAAEHVVTLLTAAFTMGLHTPSYAPARGRAHPFRIPLYDYDGVAVNEESDVRDPRDFVSIVEDPSIGDIRDPDTDLSRLVIADLRLRWVRSVAIRTVGRITEEVDLLGEPS